MPDILSPFLLTRIQLLGLRQLGFVLAAALKGLGQNDAGGTLGVKVGSVSSAGASAPSGIAITNRRTLRSYSQLIAEMMSRCNTFRCALRRDCLWLLEPKIFRKLLAFIYMAACNLLVRKELDSNVPETSKVEI